MPELCRQQGLGGRQAGVRVSGVDGRSGGGEVRWAQSAEMDTQAHVWSIPATRMKANREHRVPLRRRAVELLDAARALGDGGRPLVFTVGDREPLDERCFGGFWSGLGSRPPRMASARRSETGRRRRRSTGASHGSLAHEARLRQARNLAPGGPGTAGAFGCRREGLNAPRMQPKRGRWTASTATGCCCASGRSRDSSSTCHRARFIRPSTGSTSGGRTGADAAGAPGRGGSSDRKMRVRSAWSSVCHASDCPSTTRSDEIDCVATIAISRDCPDEHAADLQPTVPARPAESISGDACGRRRTRLSSCPQSA